VHVLAEVNLLLGGLLGGRLLGSLLGGGLLGGRLLGSGLLGGRLLGGLLGSGLLSGLLGSGLLGLLGSRLLGGLRLLGLDSLGLLSELVGTSALAGSLGVLEGSRGKSPLEGHADLGGGLDGVNLVVGADVLKDGLTAGAVPLLRRKHYQAGNP